MLLEANLQTKVEIFLRISLKFIPKFFLSEQLRISYVFFGMF